MKRTLHSISSVVACLVCLACAPFSAQGPATRTMETMESLVRRVRENPNDHEAIRDIGIHYLNQRQFETAIRILAKSRQLDPSDAAAAFHLGLALESVSRHEEALSVYRTYDSVDRSGNYGKMMKARYEIVTREVMRRFAQSLKTQEEALTTGGLTVDADRIAVMPFQFTGGDERYASLGRGLSEMMITDLSQIQALKLVERIRLQALFDEMQLQQTGLIDPESAPRFGRMFRAGQVLYGVYDVRQDETLDVDLEFFDLAGNRPSVQASANDALDNLFMVEKRIVLSVLVKMGIRLTQEQKEKIMFIPTRNIQAFLAYCKGLEQKDSGQFQAAAASFQSALRMDPEFSVAEAQMEESRTLITASGDSESMLTALDAETVAERPGVSGDLMSARLENLSQNIGAALVPGQDTREAAVEATSSGADVGAGDLPRPPTPPR